MKTPSFLSRAIETVETTPLTLATFVTTFFALIIVRLLVENALGLLKPHTLSFFFFEFTHTFLFFLCSFIILIPIARFAGKTGLRQAANILLFGFPIILLPPIIDTFLFRGTGFWSFYEFDGLRGLIVRFFTLFGDTPDIGITFGVRVEVVLVTLGIGLYAFCKSGRIGRTILAALLAYLVLFILGTFPSWLTLGILSFEKSFLAVNATDVAALFLSPERIFMHDLTDFRNVLNVKMSLVYGVLSVLLTGLLLFREYPKYFIALWKNARLPQLIYHGGLLCFGILLGFLFSDAVLKIDFFQGTATLVLLAAVESAWLASVVVNDIHDTRIDAETNPDRPLIQQNIPIETYRSIGILFFVTSILFAGIVSFPALLLLLAYQGLAWLYSASPLRLKRFPVIATLLAAMAGLIVFSIGFLLVAPEHGLRPIPLPLLFFLFFAYAATLPIKDFKDVSGDKKDGVYTFPVLLGIPAAKLFIGSCLFLCFVISPLILNAHALFLPAFLFGSLAFFALSKANSDESSFLSFRRLPAVILGLTIIYGLLITALLS